MNIYFVTSNEGKLASAKRKMLSGIELSGYPDMAALAHIHEPQERAVETVAIHKALDFAPIINAPFIVHDGGFFIDALNEFPGALARPVIEGIGAAGFLRLIPEGASRTCHFMNVLGFWSPEYAQAHPDAPVKTFITYDYGTLSLEERANHREKQWSELWRIFIPEGQQETLSEVGEEYWDDQAKRRDCFDEFVEWFVSLPNTGNAV